MGLKPTEVKSLCLRDFNLMITGYLRRQEKEWNHTRHLMSYILNYAGMVAPENFVRPQDIWPLSLDKEDVKKIITTMHQAMQLLKEFKI